MADFCHSSQVAEAGADGPWRRLPVCQVNGTRVGQTVFVRARLHCVRPRGNKLVFLVLREETCTVQAVLARSETIPVETIKLVGRAGLESLVEVEADVVAPGATIKGCTQKDVELAVRGIAIISRPVKQLPFTTEEASCLHNFDPHSKDLLVDKIEAKIAAARDALDQSLKAQSSDTKEMEAKLDELRHELQRSYPLKIPSSVKWDNRVLDLRTPANRALFKLNSGVCQLFREFLLAKGFIEVHTPRIRSAPSAGHPEFKLRYFDDEAFLGHSSLHLQGAICADFERVFEIGPVFRAHAATTHRHLNEYTGLEFEMAINEHYHEAVDVVDELFVWIFDGLKSRHADDLAAVRAQYPTAEELAYARPTLRLTFREAIALLNNAPADGDLTDRFLRRHVLDDFDDLVTHVDERRRLMRAVKQQYGVDFFIVDKSPSNCTSRFVMPCPHEPRYVNAFKVYLRHEEVGSGAQRIHDARTLERGTNPGITQALAELLQYGAPPHAGCAIGLERLLMAYFNLFNVRYLSLFPRTAERMTP